MFYQKVDKCHQLHNSYAGSKSNHSTTLNVQMRAVKATSTTLNVQNTRVIFAISDFAYTDKKLILFGRKSWLTDCLRSNTAIRITP